MIIKIVSQEDIPVCAEVIRQSCLTVADEFGLTKENASTNGAFLEDARLLADYESGVKMFGLYADDALAGFVALEEKENGFWYLEKLAVLPEHRHGGYGKALMDHAREVVVQSGGKEISIGIIYENTRLLNWYAAYGFAQTGTKRFAHLPFTVCFMRLCL
jgi:ribosomal protein S18 acetylase RimI-like enzyme